jgi:hypothetical protein
MSPRHGYRRTVFALGVLLIAAVALAFPYNSLFRGATRPDLHLAASLHTSAPVRAAVSVVHSVAQNDPQSARIAQVTARSSYNASVMRAEARRLAKAKAEAKAKAKATPDPAVSTPAAIQTPVPQVPAPQGDPQQIAQGMLSGYGWSGSEFSCLLLLWNEESGWNVYAENMDSGAYGIPQALPGDKMASAGSDWQTSAYVQVKWGFGYIASVYGTPCSAWAHEQEFGWY